MNYMQCTALLRHLEACEPKNAQWCRYIRRRGAEVQAFISRMEEFAAKNMVRKPGQILMAKAEHMQGRLDKVLANCKGVHS